MDIRKAAYSALRYDPVWRGALIPINDSFLRERVERAWRSIQLHGWRLVGENDKYIVGDKHCICCQQQMDEEAVIVALEYSERCQFCGQKLCLLLHEHYACECGRNIVCQSCAPRMGHRPKCDIEEKESIEEESQ